MILALQEKLNSFYFLILFYTSAQGPKLWNLFELLFHLTNFCVGDSWDCFLWSYLKLSWLLYIPWWWSHRSLEGTLNFNCRQSYLENVSFLAYNVQHEGQCPLSAKFDNSKSCKLLSPFLFIRPKLKVVLVPFYKIQSIMSCINNL